MSSTLRCTHAAFETILFHAWQVPVCLRFFIALYSDDTLPSLWLIRLTSQWAPKRNSCCWLWQATKWWRSRIFKIHNTASQHVRLRCRRSPSEGRCLRLRRPQSHAQVSFTSTLCSTAQRPIALLDKRNPDWSTATQRA